ncbi:MAG: carboxypeptidase-like regulatory domain-containing protein [Candidatus Poseidoniaceae archaeon]
MRRELMVAIIILLSTLVIPTPVEATNLGGEDPGVTDTVTWRVGDKWVYAGAFDPTVLVQSAGVNAAVGTINGDATTTVDAVSEIDVQGVPTLVYETSSKADFDKGGVALEGYTGNLFIQYQVDEVRRVSDLAKLSTDLSLNVRYVPYGISSLTQQIADITISTDYDPMSENYDFPLRIGETWNTSYVSSTAWSGSSDYITPFPQPTSGANHTNWEITDVGKPINSLGEQIAYGGCNASYELTSYDDNGTQTSYEWFCPEVRNFAWSHTEEDIGLVIDFRLKQYMPVASSGVVANTNPGYRNMNLDVELSTEITALNTPIEVWANVTDSSGTPQSGQLVEIRHEAEGITASGVTSSNGSFWTIVQVGEATDTSATTVDWASHGIVAVSGSMYGVATITLDENIVGLDLVAGLERASILRNRSGELTTLNSISGFNVLPGDVLGIQLPVYNRGVTTSAPTTVHITYPDGYEVAESLPALAFYEQFIFEMEWVVDINSSIENITVEYEVDKQSVNTNDANSSNDVGILSIFVGSAPTFVAENKSTWTNEKILIDASASFDEDGGDVWCEFDIEYDDGSRTTANQKIMRDGCSVNWTWIDDGLYSILVTVYDEEGDETTESIEFEILNRAPSVSITSQRSQVKVEHPVTLYVFANDSDSEDAWPGLVDIHWPTANCQEGYYTRVCTTTAWEEGLQTFTAVGTDDDGNQTYASINIEFTNIAPHDVAVTMWDGNDNLIDAGAQLTWQIQEDQEIELSARAEDSIDDLTDLSYEWSFGFKTDGRESRVPMVWNDAGMKTILVKAIDSEGEDSGWVERWVDVQNLEPQIEELPEVMAVAEGQSFTLSGVAWDTPSDMESLIVCWDTDPGADTDGIGSADDDCDVEGANLTWSWQNSGVYNVVFHATDDNGARNSSSAAVTVLNLPPLVMVNVPSKAIAGESVKLDASATRDSPIDKEYLTVVWDVDCSVDSDGDGIKDNDADLVGTIVEYEFPRAGKFEIKAIAWDEEILRPSSKSVVIEVDSPDMTAFEQVVESLAGEGANPFFQLLGISIGIAAIVFFLKRGQKKKESVWEADDLPEIIAPMEAPSMDMFRTEHVDIQQPESTIESLPLPEGGLPDGWTMEQWQHYGHQYIQQEDTVNKHNQM